MENTTVPWKKKIFFITLASESIDNEKGDKKENETTLHAHVNIFCRNINEFDTRINICGNISAEY